ncbi:uncharacterized protein NECHADRAFT_91425 [Fusarium vanettenii 77-13-4]|uniref:DUF6594 domain-containing protein n=1 Tax=Fusarium vanettenii (strain ATCC MYA-4622 / CBS 123669 / FGSC 9596 / NRRL 45880 / 77-13-4) TaxID=660122 RepID=C7ZC84_FUSV7|nr:uncharacterized protein NECHADRAFT_91425 [Fusarium vanettenii 77-13-4]EEU38325.1 hypothetical protein NECHADRAFT_91425 [Fusarium vanettenii 77-13-4]
MEAQRRIRYVDGFPSLANFIASDRDGTSTIFKRFNRLAARNLLLLQSELAELEARLDEYDREDSDRGMEVLQSLRNWEEYKARNDKESDRMKLLDKIKITLKDYREAMIFESTLATIPPPDRKTLKAFRNNFFHKGPERAEGWPMLGGHSSSLYDDPDDLVVLHTAEPPDRLTMFVQDYFGFMFKATSSSSVGYASGKRISAFISYLSTILAALLLIGAIVVLYNIKTDNLKLGLIALFTIIFAASVGLLTNARRAEVFGATAAYAAVLVVFVSGDLGS